MTAGVVRTYQMFARLEAHGRSPAYEALAAAAAADPGIVSFIASLPAAKRQPNLLFAAARYLLDAPASIGSLRALVRDRPAELAAVMRARRTQTNEPARCAVLLPALAQLPEPLALVDVGASAGLTMLFDRYSYDYGGRRLAGADPDAPTLRCQVAGPAPLPDRIPAIVWRIGLDLNPLDVTVDDDVRWLSCLVWPDEEDRAERLAAAIASARRAPPSVIRGDLLTDLPAVVAGAPADATVVVYHSSVLCYVTPSQREQFARTVGGLDVTWLTSESPGDVPGTARPSRDGHMTVLARDGRPLALADSHGTRLQWLGLSSGQNVTAGLRSDQVPACGGRRSEEATMRFGTLLLVIWLLIGVAAAGQRGYYDGSIGSCTKVGTIAVTIITGPLNYLGVNPKIDCTAPKPSR